MTRLEQAEKLMAHVASMAGKDWFAGHMFLATFLNPAGFDESWQAEVARIIGEPLKSTSPASPVTMETDWQGHPIPANETPSTVINVWSVNDLIAGSEFDEILNRSWQGFLAYVENGIETYLERFGEEDLMTEGATITIKLLRMPKSEYDGVVESEFEPEASSPVAAPTPYYQQWKATAELNSKLEEELETVRPFREVAQEIDKIFGCDHTRNGAEDCQNLVRHVREMKAELADLREKVNAKYWEGIAEENTGLRALRESLETQLENAKGIIVKLSREANPRAEKAEELLARAYDAGHRHGFEEGETTSECMDAIHAHLCNVGKDPNAKKASSSVGASPVEAIAKAKHDALIYAAEMFEVARGIAIQYGDNSSIVSNQMSADCCRKWAKEFLGASPVEGETIAAPVIHGTSPGKPFHAVCGSDEPNQQTTNVLENVTCPKCDAADDNDGVAVETDLAPAVTDTSGWKAWECDLGCCQLVMFDHGDQRSRVLSQGEWREWEEHSVFYSPNALKKIGWNELTSTPKGQEAIASLDKQLKGGGE